MYDRKIAVIVQLTDLQEGGEEVCAEYWPTEVGTEMDMKGYSVELLGEEELVGFTVRTFSVLEKRVSSLIHLSEG